jgi:alpha-aminoadipate/glutamate carrier protein LysW
MSTGAISCATTGSVLASSLEFYYENEQSGKELPMNATCPECEAAITLADDAVEGEIIVCPDCAAELELISLDPPELLLAPEVGEDWGE